jgi:type I restriction-modification system DNA methylase subunit
MDKLKFDLFAALRTSRLEARRVAAPLSMMLLWSQFPTSELKELPTLRDASAEFVLNASDRIENSLCPEIMGQIGRIWTGQQASDVEIMRRAIINALDSGLSADEIAEAILGYCAPLEWGSEDHSNTLLAALDSEKGMRIRCAFSYAIRPAWALSKQAIVELDVENHDLASLLSILAKACGRSLSVRVVSIDAVADTATRQSDFDHALIVPPLGMRLKLDASSARHFKSFLGGPVSAEAFASLWGAHIGRKRNIVVVGNGLLFRTSSNDAAFKQELIQHHGLEAVISLPRWVAPGVGVSMSALVFAGDGGSKSRKETVRFINADDQAALDPAILSKLLAGQGAHPLCVDCSIQKVSEASFNLSVDRYVLDQETRRNRELLNSQETVGLSDLADIRRPQALPRECGKETAFEVREAMLADIKNGRLSLPAKLSELPQSASTKIENAVLKPGDILLSIKGTIGKIALVTDDTIAESGPVPIVPGQSFVIIRMRKGGLIPDPRVLVGYLRSPVAQSLLQRMAGGTTIANVAMGDLKNLEVPVISMKAQHDIVEKHNECQDIQRHIDMLIEKKKDMEEQIFGIALGKK